MNEMIPYPELAELTIAGIDEHLAQHGGSEGEFLRFDRSRYVTRDGDELAIGTQVALLLDRASSGWIKFKGQGNPPDKRMGPLFRGWTPPTRAELGDLDKTAWSPGLDNKPEDPWKYNHLFTISTAEQEIYILSLMGKSQIGCALDLVRMCKGYLISFPQHYPLLRLDRRPKKNKFMSYFVPYLPENGKILKANLGGEPEPIDKVPF